MQLGNQLGRGTRRSEIADLPSLVAVLDIGSTKISCMIAEPSGQKNTNDHRMNLKVIGLGQTASRGVRCGAIADVEETERAIRIAVDTAERASGRRIKDVHVNVSGGKPTSISTRALLKSQTGVISPRDVENCVASAIAKADIGKRHVLHVTPFSFSLDGVVSDKAPLGMHGDVLGAEVAVVTLDQAHMRNMTLAVERAHLRIASFGLSAYAAGRGTLLPDEMTLGAVVIDFGGATTGFSVFRSGKLMLSGIVPVGSTLITSDVAQGLATSLAHAERMKNMFGSVLPYAHEDREMLAVPLLGERGIDSVQQVPKHVLSGIIRPRLEEIFELVQQQLTAFGVDIGGLRLVLTGGGSQMQGLREFAAQYFGCSVRLGAPVLPQGVPESAKSNALAVCAGLLSLAIRPDSRMAMPRAAQDRIEQSQLGYATRVGRWLKEAF